MSELLTRLTETPMSVLQNWRQIIAEINSEYNRATTRDYRVALLALYKATINIAETNIAPEDLARFKEDHLKYYKSYLVQESLVSQHICAQTLDEVTQREVAAGRMDPDDTLRRNAVLAVSMPHLSRAELIEIDAKQGVEAPKSHGPNVILGWIRRIVRIVS